MVSKEIFPSREDWLGARKSYIGGSDAACILGENPWKTNVQLWEEKTGRTIPEDLSDNELVIYGIRAEEHIRALFELDHPEYAVFYEENNMFLNDETPWAHYSADGWLMDENHRMGLLEIKTSTISSGVQGKKWLGQIPQNYYIQILHGLMVTEYEFAVLRARIKHPRTDGSFYIEEKDYRIDRNEDEIKFLREKEEEFAYYLKNEIRPALLLPEI